MSTVSNTPAEALEVAQSGLLKKVHAPPGATVVSAMFAGALIGAGFIFYATTQLGAAGLPHGVGRAIGGLAFSGGLFVVIVMGADLFTSSTMTSIPLANGRLRVGKLLQHWAGVYLCNMLGAGLFVALVFYSGTGKLHGGEWGAILIQSATAKVSHTFVEAFCLGILCNLFVCLAVWVAFIGKTVVDRFVAVLFPIALFVATGFEHSVANMFIIPMGLAFKAEAHPATMAALGGADISQLTWGSYFLDNLLPVTLGNIVAGSIMVGLGMWWWHRRRDAQHAEPGAVTA